LVWGGDQDCTISGLLISGQSLEPDRILNDDLARPQREQFALTQFPQNPVHMDGAEPECVGQNVGVWLFYVKHQFEETYWSSDEAWRFHEAALYGSSHYDLPVVLRWFTANIGIHHVHHLYSRIPFYRLGQVLRDHPELAHVSRLTLLQSFAHARFSLWDEHSRRLVSIRQLGDP
jgi:fatty acid desaturase